MNQVELALAQGLSLFIPHDISMSSRVLRNLRERGQNPNLDRRRRLRVGGDHQERAQLEGIAAYVATDSLRDAVRKSLAATNACRKPSGSNESHLV